MSQSLNWVLAGINQKPFPDVLELGTRRWREDKPTHRAALIPEYKSYIMSDFMEGLDVDVIADAHELSKHFEPESFDLIWGFSLFEHLKKPWIAAQEICKILKPGGYFFFQTHHTFPIHGYPNDYFRYNTEGLESLFDWASELKSDYMYPCTIVTDEPEKIVRVPAYLNSNVGGKK